MNGGASRLRPPPSSEGTSRRGRIEAGSMGSFLFASTRRRQRFGGWMEGSRGRR